MSGPDRVLTPEQVAEMRTEAASILKGDMPVGLETEDVEALCETVALCDTVDHLRAGYEAKLQLAGDVGNLNLLLQGELETLRGIARRLRDGWRASLPVPPFVHVPSWLGEGVNDPMSEAEVSAIYGMKEDSE